LRLVDDFFAEDLRGTFAPFLRASESPIAIACFRLVTLRPLPDFRVPFFLRCIADSTRLLAAFPYFLPPDGFRAAIVRRLLNGGLSDFLFLQFPFSATCPPTSRRDFRGRMQTGNGQTGAALIADTEDVEGAVRRLTRGIEPPKHRDILTRCLTGALSPAVALMQLLIDTEEATVVRATVDEITIRAAALSRSSDSLLRDRVDELTQLMVEIS
jgi:hypothetical protein